MLAQPLLFKCLSLITDHFFPSLYSEGVIPICFLKHLLKYLGSLNPVIYATCEKLYSPLSINCTARLIRISRMKSTGDKPMIDFNF